MMSSQRCTTSENSPTRQAGLLTSADTVKEGPVSRTSGGPENQEGVDLEDSKRTVKEGPVSRTSGEPEKQEGVDLGGRWTVKEGPVVRT
ncbi:hypothetical protein PF010_g11539 [Phytophthora fragariae]|uniref:Uncharacterized protein n=1 Tax=Phytophthora fragariae TaxID=53985 RepID=A0A6A3Z3R2_9STRA|nr:hypothetical protein PF011_g10792 [Phytophthora fragariae]KAE9109466.1 hypothetical protein PF010_g11539 [Phytophthora fragariae]KAE9109515.1 hypothetical protein PF007_g12219 [Phytophthora fragariae]KAE9228708.1 hypothetical protein PF002_g13466 [Phytophthora fragariae]KAE9230634.1 hypothetical protein PF004_g10450 [Phytophthora fragariae]